MPFCSFSELGKYILEGFESVQSTTLCKSPKCTRFYDISPEVRPFFSEAVVSREAPLVFGYEKSYPDEPAATGSLAPITLPLSTAVPGSEEAPAAHCDDSAEYRTKEDLLEAFGRESAIMSPSHLSLLQNAATPIRSEKSLNFVDSFGLVIPPSQFNPIAAMTPISPYAVCTPNSASSMEMLAMQARVTPGAGGGPTGAPLLPSSPNFMSSKDKVVDIPVDDSSMPDQGFVSVGLVEGHANTNDQGDRNSLQSSKPKEIPSGSPGSSPTDYCNRKRGRRVSLDVTNLSHRQFTNSAQSTGSSISPDSGEEFWGEATEMHVLYKDSLELEALQKLESGATAQIEGPVVHTISPDDNILNSTLAYPKKDRKSVTLMVGIAAEDESNEKPLNRTLPDDSYKDATEPEEYVNGFMESVMHRVKDKFARKQSKSRLSLPSRSSVRSSIQFLNMDPSDKISLIAEDYVSTMVLGHTPASSKRASVFFSPRATAKSSIYDIVRLARKDSAPPEKVSRTASEESIARSRVTRSSSDPDERLQSSMKEFVKLISERAQTQIQARRASIQSRRANARRTARSKSATERSSNTSSSQFSEQEPTIEDLDESSAMHMAYKLCQGNLNKLNQADGFEHHRRLSISAAEACIVQPPPCTPVSSSTVSTPVSEIHRHSVSSFGSRLSVGYRLSRPSIRSSITSQRSSIGMPSIAEVPQDRRMRLSVTDVTGAVVHLEEQLVASSSSAEEPGEAEQDIEQMEAGRLTLQTDDSSEGSSSSGSGASDFTIPTVLVSPPGRKFTELRLMEEAFEEVMSSEPVKSQSRDVNIEDSLADFEHFLESLITSGNQPATSSEIGPHPQASVSSYEPEIQNTSKPSDRSIATKPEGLEAPVFPVEGAARAEPGFDRLVGSCTRPQPKEPSVSSNVSA